MTQGVIYLYCLHHSVAPGANFDFSPAQPKHPLSKSVCKQSQRRLYGKVQLHRQHVELMIYPDVNMRIHDGPAYQLFDSSLLDRE